MKNRPEIEGELRHLLAEIVADPRSSLRLAPRRPLREWFDGGEAIRARSVDGTRAERHLIAAHREALAAMLLEAAKIAYWKAPVLSLRPIGRDGAFYDERASEERWRPLAKKRAELSRDPGCELELLRACLTEIPADRGHALALASLSLVPSDAARYYVTRTLPWDRPRTAISLLQKLSESGAGEWKSDAFSSLGARLCVIGRLSEARDAHRKAAACAPSCFLDLLCALNLSCLLGDDHGAASSASTLERLVEPNDPRLLAMIELLKASWVSRTARERDMARAVSWKIGPRVPQAAFVLIQAFQS